MKILVLNHGKAWQAVAATSLIKGLVNKYSPSSITWATCSDNCCLHKYNKDIKHVAVGFGPFHEKYDIAINLIPNLEAAISLEETDAKEKLGFSAKSGEIVPVNEDAEQSYEILVKKQSTKKHYLQIPSFHMQ